MLVLLIIFMVTAPLISPGEIELPSVKNTLTTPALPPLEIIVKQDRSLLLRDQSSSAPAKAISREALIEQLKARQQKNAEQPVVIAADKATRYEDVIAIVDLLQQQHIKKVGLLARSTP